jgi:hypothetical protein
MTPVTNETFARIDGLLAGTQVIIHEGPHPVAHRTGLAVSFHHVEDPECREVTMELGTFLELYAPTCEPFAWTMEGYSTVDAG